MQAKTKSACCRWTTRANLGDGHSTWPCRTTTGPTRQEISRFVQSRPLNLANGHAELQRSLQGRWSHGLYNLSHSTWPCRTTTVPTRQMISRFVLCTVMSHIVLNQLFDFFSFLSGVLAGQSPGLVAQPGHPPPRPHLSYPPAYLPPALWLVRSSSQWQRSIEPPPDGSRLAVPGLGPPLPALLLHGAGPLCPPLLSGPRLLHLPHRRYSGPELKAASRRRCTAAVNGRHDRPADLQLPPLFAASLRVSWRCGHVCQLQLPPSLLAEHLAILAQRNSSWYLFMFARFTVYEFQLNVICLSKIK